MSPRRAATSARTSRHAMAALRSEPASSSASAATASASSTRPCSRSARPRNAAAWAASPSRPRPRSPSYASRKHGLGRLGLAVEQLDEPGGDLGLEPPVGEAELLDGAAGRGDHAAAGVGPAPQGFEHGLAAQRDRLDRGRAGGDAQHAHDVEAAAAGAGDRARAPERGGRRLGEDRVGEAAVVGPAGGGEGGVEGALGGADLPEPLEGGGVDVVGLRLAAEVADGPHGLGGGADRLHDLGQPVGLGEHREQACVGRVPGGEALRTAGDELEPVDRHAGGDDVARGQQGVAARQVEGRRHLALGVLGGVDGLDRHAVEVGGLLVGEALHRAIGGAPAGGDRLAPRRPRTRTRTSGTRGRRGGHRGRPAWRRPRAARRSSGGAGPA